jgi:hypothetical protein
VSDPALTRVQFATYNSSQQPTQATVAFFRLGAIVTTATSVDPFESDKLVNIDDLGSLAINDSVNVGAGGPVLIVDGILSATQITVTNPSGTAVSLAVGARLVRQSGRPALFLQRGGPQSPTSALTTDPNTGRGSGYLAAGRFEYTVQPVGGSLVGYPDAPGGNFRDDVSWNDVRDFPGIQAAIDALPAAGGVVYLPTGIYDIGDGLTIAREGVGLLGDGLGTVIRPSVHLVNAFDLLTVTAGHCRISSLLLDGRRTLGSGSTKSCLVIKHLPSTGNINGCHLENVAARNGPKHGLLVNDALTTLFVNCEFTGNGAEGVNLSKTTVGVNGMRFLSCIFSGNAGPGVVANDAAGLSFYGCDFEANNGGVGVTQGNALEAHRCNRVEMYSCYVKDADTTSTVEQFVLFDTCASAIVDSCWFQGSSKPNRAVRFKTSPWSRLTSNASLGMALELALFSNDSHESVEFGNRETDTAGLAVLPRITMGDARVLGLSRRALGLYTYVDESERPPATYLREGSMVWVNSPSGTNSKLQVYGTIGGTTKWWNIALT